MLPTIALLVWPVVAMVIFTALGRERGLIWSTIVGYLFLPDGFELDLPALPSYAKFQAVTVGGLLGAFITRPKPTLHGATAKAPPAASDPVVKNFVWGALILLLLGPFFTMLTNGEPYIIGTTVRPATGLGDVRGHLAVMAFFLAMFFLGQNILNTEAAHKELFRVMVLVGLAYSLLVLFELRMSPQLNRMVYGYFPHHWIQHLRGGGFRPIVFLDHGLSVGFFLTTAVLAGGALIRFCAKEERAFYIVATIWLFVVLAISRNLGAFALALLFLPMVLGLTVRVQARIAAIVAILFLVNPLARHVYVDPILAGAKMVSEARWQSLDFRFHHEEALLSRAEEKPAFGWGPRSRWRVHDETGQDVTVSDGTWIITFGKWGWAGYLGFFGLLSVPVLLLRRFSRRQPLTTLATGFSIIIAVNLIYLIPNSTLSPITWLMAGGLVGFIRYMRPQDEDDPAVADTSGPTQKSSRPTYTRFPQDQQVSTYARAARASDYRRQPEKRSSRG